MAAVVATDGKLCVVIGSLIKDIMSYFSVEVDSVFTYSLVVSAGVVAVVCFSTLCDSFVNGALYVIVVECIVADAAVCGGCGRY